jgi:hypothetical protein
MDNPKYTIQRGSRIKAEWFDLDFNTALAGAQLKAVGKQHSIIGTVRHLRTNDPDWAIENVTLFIELDNDDGTGKRCERCGVNEVQIKHKWITEVISL